MLLVMRGLYLYDRKTMVETETSKGIKLKTNKRARVNCSSRESERHFCYKTAVLTSLWHNAVYTLSRKEILSFRKERNQEYLYMRVRLGRNTELCILNGERFEYVQERV